MRIIAHLPYRAPLAAPALMQFLGARAVAGVDEVRDGWYRRALRLPGGTAHVGLMPGPAHIQAELYLADIDQTSAAVAACRRLLDLDADAPAIDAALGVDPALTPVVASEPGLRVPGAVDGFEIAVRAIVGQQISVASARTVLARLVQGARVTFSRGDRPIDQVDPAGQVDPFPEPAAIAEAPDSAFAMPVVRRATIRRLAEAVAAGDLHLDGSPPDRTTTVARLREIPGIGAWTAGYVAMRALADPDVFLAGDLAAQQAAARLGLPSHPRELDSYAQRWQPWRSYALLRLWRS